jgi:hypothetical protein
MATVQTVVIPEAQMKVRWRETYVSEGINKALAVLDPGIYRGGYVMAQGTPNKTVKITPNGEQDSFYLWVEKSGGAALAVRYATDVTVDLSGQFTGGGGTMPSTKTYYVYLSCTYATGAATSGAFYVDTTAPATSGSAVRLAKITIPMGATTILDSYIDRSTSATPASCYRMTASLDRVTVKRASLDFAAPTGSPLVFQITGKVYCPWGGGAWTLKSSFIQLGVAAAEFRMQGPYVGDDNGRITVATLYADSGATTLATADSEGFVTNPWIKLDMGHTSDTAPPAGTAWYWTRATVRDLVTDDRFLEEFDLFPHAEDIITRDVAGDPTSITGKNVAEALAILTGAINGRVPQIDPETAPSGEVQIWRSHGITEDADVTGQTITLYWGSTLGFAAIVGGYIDGGNFYRAPVAPATSVTMLRLSSDNQMGPMLLAKHGAFGGGLAWNNLANWGAYTRVGNVGGASGFDIGGGIFNITALIANVVGLLTLDSGVTLVGGQVVLGSDASFVNGPFEPGTGGNDACCLLWQGGGSSAIKSRIYFGGAGSLMLTTNARWVQGTSKWVPDDDGWDAKMLSMSTLLGFQMSTKSSLTAGFATGWAILAWDATISWLDSFIMGHLSPVVTGGGSVEVVPLGFGWWNQTGGNAATFLYSEIHKTFRGVVDTITYDMSNQSHVAGMPTTISGTAADGYGAMAFVLTDIVANATAAYWHGNATVTYL